jgi:hypothetical protein
MLRVRPSFAGKLLEARSIATGVEGQELSICQRPMKTSVSKFTLAFTALVLTGGIIVGAANAQSDKASPNVPSDPGIPTQIDKNNDGKLDQSEIDALKKGKKHKGKKKGGKKGGKKEE